MPDSRKRQNGSALIMATLSLVVLCGMVGLTVDAGWAYFRKQAEQSAAEAAALAAVQYAQPSGFACSATVICGGVPQPCPYPSGPPASNLQVGCYYATLNGFNANPPQNVVLTAGLGTLSGGPTDPTVLNVANGQPYYTVPTYYWVTAQIVESIPQLFSAVLGNMTMVTSARATAAYVPIAMNACGYILGLPAGNFALTLDPGPPPAIINAPNCNLFVNGTVSYPSPNALNIGQLDLLDPAMNPTPCNNQPACAGVNYNNSFATPFKDPLVNVLAPAPGPIQNPPAGTQTYSPGTYCGGINISGNATFSPGTYYIAGGGLNVASGATLSGTGVTFYNSSSAGTACPSASPAGPVNINPGVTATLSAPTTGPLQGMLFFDRTGQPAQFQSQSLNLTGDIYFPNSAVQTWFNPGSEIMIIAQILEALGGTMTQPALGTPGGPTAQVVTLIE